MYVFEVSLFLEWREDWLVPRVHSVPASYQFEYGGMTRDAEGFHNEERREVDGIRLLTPAGTGGILLRNRMVRTEDFELALHQIFLGWARLWGDEEWEMSCP